MYLSVWYVEGTLVLCGYATEERKDVKSERDMGDRKHYGIRTVRPMATRTEAAACIVHLP